GHLHIVPLSVHSKHGWNGSEQLCIDDALTAVSSLQKDTNASTLAENAAFARLAEFPKKMLQNVHRARCKLPALAAHLLACNPQLIAAVTETIYSCDQQQLKACNQMSLFGPEPSVMKTVCFNRVQYAKMMSRNIGEIATFDIPPEQSPDRKASVLGMKIACGFEMLRNRDNGKRIKSSNQVPTDASAEIENDALMNDFLDMLKRIGYFDNPESGSKTLEQLRQHAQQHFLYSAEKGPTAELFISQAAQSIQRGLVLHGSGRIDLPVDSDPAIDDDDSWLMLEPDELDALMRKAEALVSEAAQ
ncbi:hypothetical protein H4R99_008265, partial [Coemansia sp. RSA 1722]